MSTLRATFREISAGLVVPLDEQTRIIVVPPAAMLTLVGRLFDAGKTLPLPRALPQLSEAFAFVVRVQAKRGLVVAHANPGDDAADELTTARAELIQAWLEGDPQPWVDSYEDGTPEAMRWGDREDRLLLGALLPKSSGAAAPDADTNPVKQFQTLHRAELAVDGIIGPKTRKKLVEEYFALSRRAVLAKAPPSEGPSELPTQLAAHGAGANFSLSDVEEARAEALAERTKGDRDAGARSDSKPPDTPSDQQAANDSATANDEHGKADGAVQAPAARVDVFLFQPEREIEPSPGDAGGPEFLQWVKQAEFFRTLAVGGGANRTQLSLLLSDKTGAVHHAGCKYELTGPETLTGVTDGLGHLDHDDVLPGDYQLKLTLEFFADPQKHDPADKIVEELTATVIVQSGDARPQVRMIGVVPRCELAELRGMLFETNKAFLLPSAIPDLKKIRKIYEANNPSKLLVVGHTDTTGDESINDPLSLRRAKATLAYLQDDVAAWEEFYGSSLPQSQRWGEIEDEHMRDELTRNGVEGVAAMGRTDLIRAYMNLDGAELDSGKFDIEATAHGCGENFPLDDTGREIEEGAQDDKEDALDRRVELFFFDTEFGIVPKPRGENSAKNSKQYPAWRELAETTLLSEVGARGTLRSSYALDETRELTEEFTEYGFVNWMGAVFGHDIPVDAYRKLYAELKDGSYVAPRIIVLDEIPGGHLAAYNRTTRTIEVQHRLIENAIADNTTAYSLMGALLEEFGHHLDHDLRNRFSSVGGDAALDEGAVFGYGLIKAQFDDEPTALIGTYSVSGVSTDIVVDFADFHEHLDEVLSEWEQRSDERDNHREYFGAGRGKGHGHSFGHESIEDALAPTFSERERHEVYFGNWLRDHSQALTGVTIRPPHVPRDFGGYSAGALTQVLDILAREHFEDSPEFRVTPQRLGVYRYEEHIDNPKGLKDDTGIDPRLNREPDPGSSTINETTWLMKYIDQDVNGHPCALSYMKAELQAALKEGETAEGRRRFGQGLHVLEDFFSHSNFMELALRSVGHSEVFPFAGKLPLGQGTVTPVVTGVFGFDDTAASITYVVAEHMTKSTECTPGVRGPGAKMALILLGDRYPDKAKTAEAALSAKESFERAHPDFFRGKCEVFDYMFGWIGQGIGQGIHAGASVIDDAQTLFRDNMTTSVDPTHSQLAKDHDDHPLHAIAARCAMVAVEAVGKAMKKAWSKNATESELLAEASKFFVHPFNRRHTQSDADVNRIFTLIREWGADPANANALDRLRSSNILQHLLSSPQHAHSRNQAREAVRQGQKLRHSTRPDTDDGVLDTFLDDVHKLLSP